MKRLIILILLTSVLFSCKQEKENVVLLEGKVYNNECKSLLLFKSVDLREHMSIKIPIDKDGKFNYKLDNPSLEHYVFIFDCEYSSGRMMPIPFIPDTDKINFKLFSLDQFSENEISGSKLSTKLIEFEKYIVETFNPKFEVVSKQLDSLARINQSNSELAKELIIKNGLVVKEHFDTRLKFISEDKTLVGYSLLMQLIQSINHIPKEYPSQIVQLQEVYKLKFPNHAYTELSNNLLLAIKKVVVGKKYIDFSAKNNDDELVLVSNEIIKSKVTLIDLWAPWCGSCRKKGRDIIPLYNKYKNAGFAVIGVVGGIKTKNEYFKADKSEKYPWENLYELNDENEIWQKYNIDNAGGGTFLVDENGVILAINPSTEEVENKLIELL
jgi:thiol-disulfide isomerase/thioredoxin